MVLDLRSFRLDPTEIAELLEVCKQLENHEVYEENWNHQESWKIMKIRSKEYMKWEAIASMVDDGW